ncbi:MAG TPA: DHA2 family efflux MFS transporter permease subunit [Polyangia bacterium]|jgi:DHA2 family multidrug resistance protein
MGTPITGSKAAITFTVMTASLMALVDITIVNVALNDIRAAFGTPLDQIGWVSTGYMMANIVVIPMTGWFQRRFGYRRYFAVSILVFTAASVLCGMAWSLPSLVAFRALQGLGGGAIMPTSQAILFARYPREQHGTAAALMGLGAVTGPLLGPTIGGYLIDWSSWHWVFLVNVPLGLLAAYMALRSIEEPGFEPSRAPIDKFGIGLLAVGMASLQYVLEEGNRDGWFESRTITVLAAVAAIALITFLVHELETDHPVVDLRVFANRTYAAGTGINFLLGMTLFAGNFLFALYCGAVMRYSALDIGHVFLVSGSIQLVLLPLVGRIVGKVDTRLLLTTGILGVALSLWMNAHLTDQAGFWNLTHPMLIRAAGMSLIFIPVSILALSDLPHQQRGNATGLFNLTRELGGSLGTAWMGFLVERGTVIHGSYLREAITPQSPVVQEQLAAIRATLGAQTWTQELVPETVLALKVRLQALILSFNQGFAQATLVFLAALVLVALLKRPRGAAPAAPGAH